MLVLSKEILSMRDYSKFAKKKVLFTATVGRHINAFHVPYLQWFKDHGYELHVASNDPVEISIVDFWHHIPIQRMPFKRSNLTSIRAIRKLMKEHQYSIVHTHTPMGSVVTRIASLFLGVNRPSIIYTAHGFHFYRGASPKNWLLFYPVEKILSHVTDLVITINSEDFRLASKKFKCKVINAPGVGVDASKFQQKFEPKDREQIRTVFGIPSDAILVVYPAELSMRKNQSMAIKSMQKVVANNRRVHLLLPGRGPLKQKYIDLAKSLNLQENIHFPGFVKDIPSVLKSSDIAISTSFQEGLPVNLIEAMFAGLPVVATDVRGNRDLVSHGRSGYLVEPGDELKLSEFISELATDVAHRKELGNFGLNVSSRYDLINTLPIVVKEYKRFDKD